MSRSESSSTPEAATAAAIQTIVELLTRGIKYTPEEAVIYDEGGRWQEGMDAVMRHRAELILALTSGTKS